MVRNSTLLSQLGATELTSLLSIASIRSLHEHQTVTCSGQWDDRCFVIADGAVKEECITVAGRELVEDVRVCGELLNGHIAVRPASAPATIVAITGSRLLQFAGPELRHLLQVHSPLLSALALSLAEQLLEAREQRSWLSSASTTARILRRLLELAERCGTEVDEGIVIVSALTQEELGSWANSSRESVARLLHELRADGIIDTGPRRILIRNLRALHRRLVEEDGLPPRLVIESHHAMV